MCGSGNDDVGHSRGLAVADGESVEITMVSSGSPINAPDITKATDYARIPYWERFSARGGVRAPLFKRPSSSGGRCDNHPSLRQVCDEG